MARPIVVHVTIISNLSEAENYLKHRRDNLHKSLLNITIPISNKNEQNNNVHNGQYSTFHDEYIDTNKA